MQRIFKYQKPLLTSLLLICSTLSFAENTSPYRTFWYDNNLNDKFGFDANGNAVYAQGLSGKTINVSHQKISDNTYKFEPSAKFPYTRATINDDGLSITLAGPKKSVTLPVAPNVLQKDVLGKWYFYKNDNNIEWSAIITKREHDYDYDYVYLDHDKKVYSISSKEDYGVKFRIHNGWQIYENSELAFIITQFSDDRMEYMDLGGEKYVETRYNGESNLSIPSGYSKEE